MLAQEQVKLTAYAWLVEQRLKIVQAHNFFLGGETDADLERYGAQFLAAFHQVDIKIIGEPVPVDYHHKLLGRGWGRPTKWLVGVMLEASVNDPQVPVIFWLLQVVPNEDKTRNSEVSKHFSSTSLNNLCLPNQLFQVEDAIYISRSKEDLRQRWNENGLAKVIMELKGCSAAIILPHPTCTTFVYFSIGQSKLHKLDISENGGFVAQLNFPGKPHLSQTNYFIAYSQDNQSYKASSNNYLRATYQASVTCEYTEQMLWLKPSDLPDPWGIEGPQSFYNSPYTDIQRLLERYRLMLDDFKAGRGGTSEYWEQKDRAAGYNPYFHPKESFLGVYQAFFSDPIEISMRRYKIASSTDTSQYRMMSSNGDRFGDYRYGGGRHRVWLARRMDIELLPVLCKIYEYRVFGRS